MVNRKSVGLCAADLNCLKVPAELADEQVVLLSDILPTAWHANELGRVGKGDNVAIWGAGPGMCANVLRGYYCEHYLIFCRRYF